MKRPRIAIIGDTRLSYGELTDAGAIAMELATSWPADVGIRTIADSPESWEALDEVFGSVGVTSWMSIRDSKPPENGVRAADVRMGDTLNIDELFSHDLVIVATRDIALRRFLADLPVHTWPGVRMMSLVALHDGPIEGESLEDLSRFDVVIGPDSAFSDLAPHLESPIGSGVEALAPLLAGSNVRAAVSWGKHGAFRCCVAEGQSCVTVPPHHAPHTASDAPWATFVAAVAYGLTRRQSWDEIGREATRRFAIRAQSLRSAQV
jgi:hypothetical protein